MRAANLTIEFHGDEEEYDEFYEELSERDDVTVQEVRTFD